MDETYGKIDGFGFRGSDGATAVGHAQQDSGMGPPDGGDGMGQVFGKGNGIRGTVTAAAADTFTIRTDEGKATRFSTAPIRA